MEKNGEKWRKLKQKGRETNQEKKQFRLTHTSRSQKLCKKTNRKTEM